MDKLVEEAKELAGRGVKELVVIAQDTTKYGIDLYHRYALLELLEKLNEIDSLSLIHI